MGLATVIETLCESEGLLAASSVFSPQAEAACAKNKQPVQKMASLQSGNLLSSCRQVHSSKVVSTHLWNTPLNLYQQVFSPSKYPNLPTRFGCRFFFEGVGQRPHHATHQGL